MPLRNQPFVVFLSDPAAVDPALTGASAARLAVLKQANLPVPNGFIVTTAVFRTAPHGEITPDVEAAIERAYASLTTSGSLCLAPSVYLGRNSELPALRQQLYHASGLSGPAGLSRAIERCWQSATAPELRALYAQQQLAAEDVLLAVLIQAEIASSSHGVSSVGQAPPPALSSTQAFELNQLLRDVDRQLDAPMHTSWMLHNDAFWVLDVSPVAAP